MIMAGVRGFTFTRNKARVHFEFRVLGIGLFRFRTRIQG